MKSKTVSKIPTKPAVSEFVYHPKAEDQLSAKIHAFTEIIELAEHIKDAEVFRRWAVKIAKANTSFTMQGHITFKTP